MKNKFYFRTINTLSYFIINFKQLFNYRNNFLGFQLGLFGIHLIIWYGKYMIINEEII